MNLGGQEFEALIQAVIDGGASDAEITEFQQALRSDPAAMQAYAEQMRLHALLRWRAGSVGAVGAGASAMASAPPPTSFRRLRWLGLAMAAAAAFVVLSAIVNPNRAGAANATAALDRMIAVARRGGDRTYALSVIEGEKAVRLINQQAAVVEGATLHLGGGGGFVYECDLSDGTRRITGSDGLMSWDIIGPQPVHLSHDPGWFRHHVPGQSDDFTLLDPAAELAVIREGYDISLTGDSDGLKQLKAVKRSREYRGPREALISFDPASGTIHSMDFIGLPQGRGGPSSVRLTLTGQNAFPPDFFVHTSHHESGRRVELEPAVRPPRRESR